MAKKQKERSSEEHLRGLLRNLKAENRNLKKQLSRSLKRHPVDFDIPDIEEDFELIPEPPKKDKCPKCGGELIVSDIGVRTLIKCEKCPYRQSKKK